MWSLLHPISESFVPCKYEYMDKKCNRFFFQQASIVGKDSTASRNPDSGYLHYEIAYADC